MELSILLVRVQSGLGFGFGFGRDGILLWNCIFSAVLGSRQLALIASAHAASLISP